MSLLEIEYEAQVRNQCCSATHAKTPKELALLERRGHEETGRGAVKVRLAEARQRSHPQDLRRRGHEVNHEGVRGMHGCNGC